MRGGHETRRQGHRARHGHRPDGDLLPQGPVREGRAPDRPDKVAAHVGDWDKYVASGKQYMEKAPKGTAFVDCAGVYNGVVGQGESILRQGRQG